MDDVYSDPSNPHPKTPWEGIKGCWCHDCTHYQPRGLFSMTRYCRLKEKHLGNMTGCSYGNPK